MLSPLSLALTLALVFFFDDGDRSVAGSDGGGYLVNDGSGQTHAPGWLWLPIISLPSSPPTLAVEVESDSTWYRGIRSLFAAAGESIGGVACLVDYGDRHGLSVDSGFGLIGGLIVSVGKEDDGAAFAVVVGDGGFVGVHDVAAGLHDVAAGMQRGTVGMFDDAAELVAGGVGGGAVMVVVPTAMVSRSRCQYQLGCPN